MTGSRTLPRIRTADTFLSRAVGLMGRCKWPEGHAGLFFPRCRSVHTLFTFLRPDIVFLDKNLKIRKIFASAGPWRIFWGPGGSLHCLELPGGKSRRLRLNPGDAVKIKVEPRGSRSPRMEK